jgi:hypothetical protein
LVVACIVLTLAGVNATFSPRGYTAVPPRNAMTTDLAAQAFAEAFARAYLTWDSTAPEMHERAVSRFIGADVDPAAGLVMPSTGSQRVRWTSAVADEATDDARRIVTIAAETSRGLLHLAVSVARDDEGLLFVSSAPAVVGPPGHSTKGAGSPETEVDVEQLRSVAARVVRNYLAGESDDVAADLHPRAVISLPDLRLKVRSTDAITWVSEPRRVAVTVAAEGPRDLRLALRYELSVLRVGGRWVVRTIHTNPIAREGDR